MPRTAGPVLVAGLALLLTSNGAPRAEPGGGRPPPPREPAGVTPQGLLGAAPAERPLRTGDGHGWLVRLEAGDFAHLRIEQLGADLEVALFDPAGRFLFEIDTMTPSGWDGEEQLFLHARASGLHRLELRAIDESGPAAAYRARVARRRPATRTDLVRVRAAERFRGATALRVAGRYRDALPQIEEAEELFGRLGDERLEAESRAVRCALRFKLGDYRRALAPCRAAAAYYRREGLDADLATALTLLGRSHLLRDDPWSALGPLEEALVLLERLGDPWNLALVHTDLGMVHRQLSEYPLALRELDLALELWEQCGERSRIAGAAHERGLLYLELGQRDAAARDFRRALAAADPDDEVRPQALTALAVTLTHQGAGPEVLEPLTELLEPLERALAAAERRGNPGGAARALTAIGRIHQQTGDPEEAIRRYRRALARARAAGDRDLTGDLYYNLAWLTGERVPEGRIPHLERALAEYRAAGNRGAQVVTLLALAGAERAEGRLHAGLQRLETARILFAELRERLTDHELKLSFMAHRYRLFDTAVDLLMELHGHHPHQGWDLRALEMSEQARARGLLDLLAPAAGSALADEGPAGRPRPGAAEVLSSAAIQSRLLGPDTVLLEYKLGDPRSHLWVVEHDRIASFELPSRERLESLARAFHGRLARPPGVAAAAALGPTGAELSRALLCPARDRLDGRRLIVIAEGELLYLPFAALGLAACDGSAASSGQAPASGRPIAIAPSASALAALRGRPRPPPERTLALIADPVFDACDRRIETRHRGRDCPDGYPRLRHSAREARAILGLVPHGERLALTGFDVRRAPVEDAIARARYVHFATHTDTAGQPPRLVLSRVDRHGRPLEADHLAAGDVARLPLAADLVVLGACDTQAGRSFRGEGLVGLAHAFFEAGAGAVVVTLWPVDDEATAALIERFYRHLLHGGSTPAAALAAAQQEVSDQPRWRSPYYWAGFVLLGDGV